MRRVADRKETRVRVWQTLLEKHADSYRAHLSEVLLFKEDECGRLLLENWRIERELALELAPQLEEKRALMRNLEAESVWRLDWCETHESDVGVERAALEDALQAAHREIAALKASKSWRVTAPLRRVLDVWLTLGDMLGGRKRVG